MHQTEGRVHLNPRASVLLNSVRLTKCLPVVRYLSDERSLMFQLPTNPVSLFLCEMVELPFISSIVVCCISRFVPDVNPLAINIVPSPYANHMIQSAPASPRHAQTTSQRGAHGEMIVQLARICSVNRESLVLYINTRRRISSNESSSFCEFLIAIG